MRLEELRHVNPDQHFLVVEQLPGERTGRFGLANSRRPQEEETSCGSVLVAQSSPSAQDSVGNRVDGFVLPNDLGLQALGELQNLFLFRLCQAVHGDPRPPAHYLGNLLRSNHFSEEICFVLLVLLAQRVIVGLQPWKSCVLELHNPVNPLVIRSWRACLENRDLIHHIFNFLLHSPKPVDAILLVLQFQLENLDLLLGVGDLCLHVHEFLPRGIVHFLLEHGLLHIQPQ
mmetsp:Transcript_53922/g.109984  ORF Transcript_53922/g.109984 Transcript_53922/m.109984 type:complete len:230 (-) Transcript_53922:1802-2491(-)